jgi:hypothetical protein
MPSLAQALGQSIANASASRSKTPSCGLYGKRPGGNAGKGQGDQAASNMNFGLQKPFVIRTGQANEASRDLPSR